MFRLPRADAAGVAQWIALAIALGALIAAVISLTREPLPAEVKIGVAQPLSGNLSHQGQDMLNGVQFAVEDVNQRGGMLIQGQRVRLRLVSSDDAADPETGKIAAQRLVDQGVIAVVGHLNSGVSIAAAPIYAKAGVPQMAISTKPQYTQLQLPTTLRLVANDDLQSRAIGSVALTMEGIERIGVVDDGTPYGKGLADQTVALLEAKQRSVVLRVSLDNQTTHFPELVEGMQREGVQLLVSTLADFQIVALADQLARGGLPKVQIIGGDTIRTPMAAQAHGKVAAIFATSPILDAPEFGYSGVGFVQRFKQRFGHAPVYGAHYAYDAVQLVADALRRNQSVDKGQLLKRLKTFEGIAPVTGFMRFDINGEQRYGVIGVYRLQRGGWELVSRSDQW